MLQVNQVLQGTIAQVHVLLTDRDVTVKEFGFALGKISNIFNRSFTQNKPIMFVALGEK